MSENPTDPDLVEEASDGEGFGGPNSDADRVGPAGPDPHAAERDPDDDAGMVSG